LDLAGGSISPATGPTGPQANAALASTATSDLFPDAVSASYGCGEAVLAVAYTDRSLVVWDVRDYAKVRARHQGPEQGWLPPACAASSGSWPVALAYAKASLSVLPQCAL
jgi:hypothetical protein